MYGLRQQLLPTTIPAGIGLQKTRSLLCRCVHRDLHLVRLRLRSQPQPSLGRQDRQQQHHRKIHGYAAAANAVRTSNCDRYDHNSIRKCQSLSQSRNRNRNRVLIVGGGPTGLFLAHLLRSYNVPFRLIEAQTPEQQFKHPQAHFLNTRTMEILKHGLSHDNKTNINNNLNSNSNSNSDHPNDVYQKLRAAMPPVEEWKSFRFGPDMTCSSGDDTIMAEVVHPVDRPLAAELDANGRLVLGKVDDDNNVATTNKDSSDSLQLSPESVGHLAQHKFCQILYDALVGTPETAITTPERKSENNNNDDDDDILYGCRATGFDWNEKTGRWTVETDRGEVFDDVDAIVAADGAASTIRKNLFSGDATTTCGNDPTMLGTPTLQRLINVHFTIPDEAIRGEEETDDEYSRQLRIPPAMLYTVFHPEVLAMVVRHGPGEYVLQIPYFEPYQTPEEDFEIEKVRKMVRSILGNMNDFTIESIRPWTMGSLVARNYYSDEGVFLAGDAAHVFPPAGGFGMNTGLQDVYSLAWRLASNRQQQQHQEQQSNDDKGTSSSLPLSLSTVGRMYERERQPVARRNAALSVRNYRRVLNVMKACYLDDRHPALLIRALDATASFVPLEIRRKTFRALLQTALLPLSQLQTSPNGVYARTVKGNLRALLGSGQGLPLLFPRHEIDFSYDETSSSNNKNESATNVSDAKDDWSQDSVASSPRLALGALFPHVVASIAPETLRRFPRLHLIDNDNVDERFSVATAGESLKKVSTRDLAAQLATNETPCAFCLLEIVASTAANADNIHDGIQGDDVLSSLQKTLQGTFGLPFLMSRLIVSSKDDDGAPLSDRTHRELTSNATVCNMYVDDRQWEALDLIPKEIGTTSSTHFFVVIRPDGHVAAISSEGAHLDDLILGIHPL